MLRAAKILERMVNQNTYDEIAQGILTKIMCHRFSNIRINVFSSIRTLNVYCVKFNILEFPGPSQPRFQAWCPEGSYLTHRICLNYGFVPSTFSQCESRHIDQIY